MKTDKKPKGMDRREFIKLSVAAAVGGKALLTEAARPADAPGLNPETGGMVHRNERPTMSYRQLGRTKFMSSKLVFGGGAALSGGKGVRLLDRAFEAGINHYDLGTSIYYRGAEHHFAPFLKAHRDDIWVVSKAPLMIRAGLGEEITTKQAKLAASSWTKLLNGSLKDLQTEYIDAYYLMAVNHPGLIRSEEIHSAFLDARKAGKVGFFGVSTHENAANVLEAMIGTGWYALAMIGITPSGWYDWGAKDLVKGTPPLLDLAPLLKRARDAGIGLIGMKTARHLSLVEKTDKVGLGFFDHLYSPAFRKSPLNPFQRAYAYTLENGLDVVNSDMQNFKHLEENIAAASSAHQYVTSTHRA